MERWRRTERLAAALGYIGLCRHATVTCVPLAAGSTPERYRGRTSVPRLLEHLASLEAGGPTRLLHGLRAACPPGQPTGLAVLVSDFYELEDYPRALQFLRHRGFAVHVLHLVADEDLDARTGGLVERFRGHEAARHLQRLAAEESHELTEALIQEFRDCLAWIRTAPAERRYRELRRKAETGAITDDELREFSNLSARRTNTDSAGEAMNMLTAGDANANFSIRVTPPVGNCTILHRYSTTTYATQVVLLASLTYMFQREDWREAVARARDTEPLVMQRPLFAGLGEPVGGVSA